MKKKFRTILVGFGQVAQGIMNDKKMARYYEFQCHAQVLKSHPNIDWLAVVDNDEEKLKIAKEKWGIKNTVKSLNDLDSSALPEIIVMATRPDLRLDVLKHFPHAKGIILEKPLSRNIIEREKILDFCKKSKVKININFNRRFDNALLKIIKKFGTTVGKIQTGTIIYGNGLKNNGIHFIDQIRMILGEVSSVQALNKIKKNKFSNIEGDIDVKFVLNFKNGIQIYVSPIDFSYYREQCIDLWGSKGRIEFMQEGLCFRISKINKHRALENSNELSSDYSNTIPSQIGTSYYNLYDDLINSIIKQKNTSSPLKNAKINEEIIDGIIKSSHKKNEVVYL